MIKETRQEHSTHPVHPLPHQGPSSLAVQHFHWYPWGLLDPPALVVLAAQVFQQDHDHQVLPSHMASLEGIKIKIYFLFDKWEHSTTF